MTSVFRWEPMNIYQNQHLKPSLSYRIAVIFTLTFVCRWKNASVRYGRRQYPDGRHFSRERRNARSAWNGPELRAPLLGLRSPSVPRHLDCWNRLIQLDSSGPRAGETTDFFPDLVCDWPGLDKIPGEIISFWYSRPLK